MPGGSGTSGPRRAGPGRLLVLGACLLALLAVGERAGEWAWRRWICPTGEAAWIWSSAAVPGEGPLTFVAVRDFRLDFLPAAATLLALADEEAQVYLNGKPLALLAYRQGDPLTRVEAGSFLLPGENRIVVEARSSQGAGGLLLSLELHSATPRRIVSDSGWRVTEHLDTQTLVPGTELPGATAAAVLSLPPAGRWGRPHLGSASLPLTDLLLDPLPLAPQRARSELLLKWTTQEPADWRSPEIGRRLIFDWGEEVYGYLNLSFPYTREARGLYFAGRGPRDPDKAPAAGWFEKLEGTRAWTASEPRRFRYVTVVSTTPLNGARVFVVDPEAPGVRPGNGHATGVFGLAPASLRTPAEDEIRGELESLEGLPGGEDA
jgi:hypothetical protein